MTKKTPFFNNLAWTCFLDRDGVLNHEKKGDYVKTVEELQPHTKNIKGLVCLSAFFKYIFVVTNQKGIGKGLYTEATLVKIHAKLSKVIVNEGGRIDKIYYSTSIDNNNNLRKPNIGMAELAKKDFPNIEFSKSIMVGDTYSDMLFGKKLGMVTVLLPSSITNEKKIPQEVVDYTCKNLLNFSNMFFLN